MNPHDNDSQDSLASEMAAFEAWWFTAPQGDRSYEEVYGRSYREVAKIAWQAALATPAAAAEPLKTIAYYFSAPGISKVDVWPHGGAWKELVYREDAERAILALRTGDKP